MLLLAHGSMQVQIMFPLVALLEVSFFEEIICYRKASIQIFSSKLAFKALMLCSYQEKKVDFNLRGDILDSASPPFSLLPQQNFRP